jgi:hypothetical protein
MRGEMVATREGGAAPSRAISSRDSGAGALARPAPVGAPASGVDMAPARVRLKLLDPGSALHADPLRWRLDLCVEGPDGVEALASVWRRGANATHPTERVAARALGEGALLAVAEAARVFAPLARCLRGPEPSTLLLSAAEARALGRVYAPRLRALDVSVETPPSWDAWDEAIIPQLVAHPAALGPAKESRFSLDALVRYDWRVALGGVELTLDELEALVARAEPLVRLGDRWIELDGAALAAVVGQLRAQLAGDATQQTGARPATLLDALRALLVEGSGSESVSGADAQGWRTVRRLGAATGAFAQTLACLCGETPPAIPPPAALQATLQPHQRAGLDWLLLRARLGLGACLADDMGTGKTITSLAFLLAAREAELAGGLPSLIVCPVSLLENWRAEAAQFAPTLRVSVWHGQQRGPLADTLASEPDVVLTRKNC